VVISLSDEIKAFLINIKGNEEYKEIYDYITNLQQENERLKKDVELFKSDLISCTNTGLSLITKIDKAIEYITSYEAISSIQGLDKIEQNKTLDERTMNVMVERYLQVHHNLLNILQNGSEKDE
jgi:prephenate dehydratase